MQKHTSNVNVVIKTMVVGRWGKNRTVPRNPTSSQANDPGASIRHTPPHQSPTADSALAHISPRLQPYDVLCAIAGAGASCRSWRIHWGKASDVNSSSDRARGESPVLIIVLQQLFSMSRLQSEMSSGIRGRRSTIAQNHIAPKRISNRFNMKMMD